MKSHDLCFYEKELKQTLIAFFFLSRQEKALADVDKEERPAESKESDSEEVDKEKALAEKEEVKNFLHAIHGRKERRG